MNQTVWRAAISVVTKCAAVPRDAAGVAAATFIPRDAAGAAVATFIPRDAAGVVAAFVRGGY